MTYKGKYTLKFPGKYTGDKDKIQYRSLWERQVFRWCEETSIIKYWNSETVIIPYICKTDSKAHRYFVDLKVVFENGKTFLIEIKPDKETKPPRKAKIITEAYVKSVLTYIKNQSKWEAADKYAKERGWEFQVWTEKTLKNLGIKIL